MNPSLSSMLRLLQLTSTGLPLPEDTSAQGLIWACEQGFVTDAHSAGQWIFGRIGNSTSRVDVPVLARLRRGWRQEETDTVEEWNAVLYAMRETAALRRDELQNGEALARTLAGLGVRQAETWTQRPDTTFANMFALASVVWEIGIIDLAAGYLWRQVEQQVAAACRCLSLEAVVGQRILSEAVTFIPEAVEFGLGLDDDAIGGSVPVQVHCAAQQE